LKLISQTALAVALLAPCALVNPASAETYAALRAGFNDAEVSAFGGSISFDQGASYEGALGYDMGLFRIEAGASRDNAELGLIGFDGSLTNYSATALIDVSGPLGLNYFAGAGLDYSQASANLGFTEINGSGDGWHYDLGASSNINDAWTVEVRRRAYSGSVDLDFIGDVDVENVTWSLGLRRSL
jgi:opacity protein-like surface antigen